MLFLMKPFEISNMEIFKICFLVMEADLLSTKGSKSM